MDRRLTLDDELHFGKDIVTLGYAARGVWTE